MSTATQLKVTIALCALTAAAAATAGFVDRRSLGEGENIWRKPMKFGVSLALFLATLQWALHSLTIGAANSTAITIAVAIACVSALLELLYIVVQAARGQASHFNVATPLYSALYGLMALGAVALVACSAVFGLALLRDTVSALSETVRLATAAGFLLSSLLTAVTGFAMGGRLTHEISRGERNPQPPRRIPITNWTLTAGDLRAPHFLATHLMQAGPLAGYAAEAAAFGPWAAIAVCLALSLLTVWMLSIVRKGRPFHKLAAP